MNDMDFDHATKVSNVALRHVRDGTPIVEAWPTVVKAATPRVGRDIAKLALALPVVESVTTVTAEFAYLLGRDRPGKDIKGLWFGLVELVTGRNRTEHTLYIAGADRFDPKDSDWPCGPAWHVDDCYAPSPALKALSDARKLDEQRAWSVETMLIEPLACLMVGRLARDVPPPILLGDAPQRGIGAGFDSGDLRTLGVVTPKGFKPYKGLVPR